MKTVVLRPIKIATDDFDQAERRIKALLRREIFEPALAGLLLPRLVLHNAPEDDTRALIDALRSGRVVFDQGIFTGQFSATISKAIKALGGVWDRGRKGFRILKTDLPHPIRAEIAVSQARFAQRISKIDQRLAALIPEEIADKLKVSDLFDNTIWKTERSFQATVKGLTVAPKLSAREAERIADEWQTNMRLWIKDFTQQEIVKLRTDLRESVFAGHRYEAAVSAIEKSYGVSARKAKFLARQETSLLMEKFKEARYSEAGIMEYIWGCVAGSKAHPVRPAHKALEGRTFRWDSPPVTTSVGEAVRRNNPGGDYNCRCFAKPVVKF